ncbi:uncharacterized protein LOC144705622 [Wolffia australiana]
MDWWEKAVLPPVKRAFVAVATAARPKHGRKQGSEKGIEKLEDDVQTCGYEDVQVMWEILRMEIEMSTKPPKRKHSSRSKALLDSPAAPPPRRHRLAEIHAESPADDRRRAAVSAARCLPK